MSKRPVIDLDDDDDEDNNNNNNNNIRRRRIHYVEPIIDLEDENNNNNNNSSRNLRRRIDYNVPYVAPPILERPRNSSLVPRRHYDERGFPLTIPQEQERERAERAALLREFAQGRLHRTQLAPNLNEPESIAEYQRRINLQEAAQRQVDNIRFQMEREQERQRIREANLQAQTEFQNRLLGRFPGDAQWNTAVHNALYPPPPAPPPPQPPQPPQPSQSLSRRFYNFVTNPFKRHKPDDNTGRGIYRHYGIRHTKPIMIGGKGRAKKWLRNVGNLIKRNPVKTALIATTAVAAPYLAARYAPRAVTSLFSRKAATTATRASKLPPPGKTTMADILPFPTDYVY